MKESLGLHVPACEELWYRRKIMQDPETMSYNKGYDLDFEGYGRETGVIELLITREQYFQAKSQGRHSEYADGAMVMRRESGEL